jgi:hypothetical protein
VPNVKARDMSIEALLTLLCKKQEKKLYLTKRVNVDPGTASRSAYNKPTIGRSPSVARKSK